MSEATLLMILKTLSSAMVLAQASGISIGRVSDMIRDNGGEDLTDAQLQEVKDRAAASIANIGPK